MRGIHLDSFVQMASLRSLSLRISALRVHFSIKALPAARDVFQALGQGNGGGGSCSLARKVCPEVDFACRAEVPICRCSPLDRKVANYLKIRLCIFCTCW